MKVLILTEDRARDAVDVVQGLLLAAFRLIAREKPFTHKIRFLPAEGRARDVMIACQWRNKRRRELVDLRQAIADMLLRGGFVFFHADGDAAWSDRERSPTRKPYDALIPPHVRILVEAACPAPEVDRTMRRLHLFMPFYSVESWLYQNTAVARRLATCEAHSTAIDGWEDDRSALDEILKPKERVFLGAKHNLTLTERFPADLAEKSPSFSTLLEELRGSTDLLEALAQTRQMGH